jgi:hypothetical protein
MRGIIEGMRTLVFFFSVTLLAQDNPTARKAEMICHHLVEEARQSITAVDRQEVQDYVSKLGARLEGPDSQNVFSVIAGDRGHGLQEPISFSCGYIFVPAKLLLAANDEAEFAGMLAQAVARADMPIRFSNTSGKIPLVFIGNFGGPSADLLLPPAAMAQSRKDEVQADASAVVSMARAGFDPAALLRYIERLQPRDRPGSAVPYRAERIAALQKAIEAVPRGLYSESDEFHAIQEMVRPAPAPPAAERNGRPTLFRKGDPEK